MSDTFLDFIRQTNLSQKLVSYWKLDEPDGARLDSHGLNHLTDNNTVTSTAGKIGTAATFTAINLEYLSVADNATLDLTTEMTLAGWIRFPTATVNMTIAAKWTWNAVTPPNNPTFAMQTHSSDNDDLRIFIAENASDVGNNFADTATLNLTVNVWHHVAVVFDGAGAANADRLKLYVNGSQQTLTFTGTIAAALNNSTAALEFGRFNGLLRHWNGDLDEFGLWGRALTPIEVAQLYNAGTGRTYPI